MNKQLERALGFLLGGKHVRCPNCAYQGDAKEVNAGFMMAALWLFLFVVSFLFWPLFIISIPMFFWLIFKKPKLVCPRCNFPHPVPVDRT